jgi:hypothetical protein
MEMTCLVYFLLLFHQIDHKFVDILVKNPYAFNLRQALLLIDIKYTLSMNTAIFVNSFLPSPIQ